MTSREKDRDPGQEARQDPRSGTRSEPHEAIEVLRGVWTARGQSSDELDELFGPAKSCKNMQNVGFDNYAGSDGDIREAWRATLEREGKLSKRQGSVRDLVLGPATGSDR